MRRLVLLALAVACALAAFVASAAWAKGNAAPARLLPGQPVSATISAYRLGAGYALGQPITSVRLHEGRNLNLLIRAVNDLRPLSPGSTMPRCPAPSVNSRIDLLRFAYANRDRLTLRVEEYSCFWVKAPWFGMARGSVELSRVLDVLLAKGPPAR